MRARIDWATPHDDSAWAPGPHDARGGRLGGPATRPAVVPPPFSRIPHVHDHLLDLRGWRIHDRSCGPTRWGRVWRGVGARIMRVATPQWLNGQDVHAWLLADLISKCERHFVTAYRHVAGRNTLLTMLDMGCNPRQKRVSAGRDANNDGALGWGRSGRPRHESDLKPGSRTYNHLVSVDGKLKGGECDMTAIAEPRAKASPPRSQRAISAACTRKELRVTVVICSRAKERVWELLPCFHERPLQRSVWGERSAGRHGPGGERKRHLRCINWPARTARSRRSTAHFFSVLSYPF